MQKIDDCCLSILQAVMNWVIENPFVLSMNLHDGATVACYPFDDFYSSADEKQSRFDSGGVISFRAYF